MNTEPEATYCPEDNKLRLYVGRVPRDEYEALKAEGWTSTPKQECDFAAAWTPRRENTALRYAGMIGDEDQSPQDRAADRAERFSGYLEKRLGEAAGHADRYDSGPMAHGFQDKGRAVRAADRHDRMAGRAVDAWSKAEYWQARTAGVISHALYSSRPDVRMGRIKVIEAELRGAEKTREQNRAAYENIQKIAADPAGAVESIEKRYYPGDTAKAAQAVVDSFMGYGEHRHPRHPERVGYVSRLMNPENGDPATVADFAAAYLAKYAAPGTPGWENTWTGRTIRHLRLRLAYENQMLEAQGGRAAMLEMEAGGWIGGFQIWKVNKSNTTGRVVSVRILAPSRWSGTGKEVFQTLNIERLAAGSYRAPTAEDLELIAGKKAEKKAAAPKPAALPLINPTLEDAERLQALINARHAAEWERHHGKPGQHHKPEAGAVQSITQAIYSANSSGSHARAETRGLCANATMEDRVSNMWSSTAEARAKACGPAVCKIRVTGYRPVSVIHLTDKPARPLPASVWEAFTPAPEAPEAAPI
jgi:hypothetical protein